MFYLAIIQNAGPSSTQAIYKFDNIDDALAMYHSELAYRAASRTMTTCVILDAYGNSVYRDAWEKHVEPEGTES